MSDLLFFPSRKTDAPETVLALHSSASSGRQWDAYAGLVPGGMRWVAPDLMGYGAAPDWKSGTPVTLKAEALRLEPLLGSGNVHLVGHSYGGAVALEMALRWPERVRSLTLYEPVRFALLLQDRGAHDPVGRSIVSMGLRISALARAGYLSDSAKEFIDYWSGEGVWSRLSPARQEAIASRMGKVGAEFEALFADPVPLAAYGALAMPVRLLTGTRSPLPARQVASLLAAVCPQASLVELPDLGHMAPVTHAPKVAAHFDFETTPTRRLQAA